MWETQLVSWRLSCLVTPPMETSWYGYGWEKESHWNRQLEDPRRLWEQPWHRKSPARKQWGLSPLWELQFLCGSGCGLLHRVPWNVHPIEREEWGIYYLFSERQKASRSNNKKPRNVTVRKMLAEEEGVTSDLGYTRHCQGTETKAIPTGNKRKQWAQTEASSLVYTTVSERSVGCHTEHRQGHHKPGDNKGACLTMDDS